MALADAVRVFPAHGAGSACGKNLSTETHSTIGQQRLVNYACRPMAEREFLAHRHRRPARRAGLFRLRRRPATGRTARSARPGPTVPALDERRWTPPSPRATVLLDTRDPKDFAAGHLAGAINVGLEGRLAETAGMVMSPEDEVVLPSPGTLKPTHCASPASASTA